MTISRQIRSRPLSLNVFVIWLFLTSISLLATGIDRLISGVEHYSQQPQWLVFLALYVSAPIGGPAFTILVNAAIPVAVTAMATSIFLMKGYRTAYFAALALLFVGLVASIVPLLLSLFYALPANLVWIWVLRSERIKANFVR